MDHLPYWDGVLSCDRPSRGDVKCCFMTVKCKAGSGVANARKSDAFKRAATRWVRLDWKQIVELRERQKTQKIGKEITEATYYKREIGVNVADNAVSDDDGDDVLNLI